MMLNPKRLLQLLSPSGFEIAWRDTTIMEICLVRPDSRRGLWQRAQIHSGTSGNGKLAGRRGDAPGLITLEVSAIRGRARANNLGEKRTTDDRIVFVSPEDARRWERDFAAGLPGLLDNLATAVGPRVEAATRVFREAADAYEARLSFGTTITEIERWLEAEAGPSERAAADRLGSGQGYVPGGVSIYRLAALALIVLRREVEPTEHDFVSIRSTSEAPEFDARLQLVVDRLLSPARQNGPVELI